MRFENIQTQCKAPKHCLEMLISVICVLLCIVSCSDTVEKVHLTGTDIQVHTTAVIDAQICGGCVYESCTKVCAQNAVSKYEIDNRAVYVIDPQKCTRCGECIRQCPFGAIKWKY